MADDKVLDTCMPDDTFESGAAKADARDTEFTIEGAFSRINEILDLMEGGELPLESTFALYEEGLKLVKTCEGRIDGIEKKLKVLE